MSDSGPNSTLIHGLHLLEMLAGEYREFSIAELAERLQWPKSRVHRLLQTLVEMGYVGRSEETRRYRIRYRLMELAGSVAAQVPLRKVGQPVLRALSEEVRNLAYLIVPDGETPLVFMTDLYKGQRRSHSLDLGARLPAHASASGKLFLAYGAIPWPTLPLKAYTSKTIVTPAALRAEIRRIRDLGYSVNRGENGRDLHSFAAPVFSPDRSLVAAMGIAMPRNLVETRGEKELVQFTIEAADTLTQQLTCLS